jgi:S1-C subfamily serine protease
VVIGRPATDKLAAGLQDAALRPVGGIFLGYIVTAVNAKPVVCMRDLAVLLDELRAGDTVSF